MAKKIKSKKSSRNPTPLPPPHVDDGDDLLNELIAHLDSRDPAVQSESATILHEMENSKPLDPPSNPSKPAAATLLKKDPKARFIARQVKEFYLVISRISIPYLFSQARKAAALQQHYTDNPEADAKLEEEAKAEEREINRLCDQYNLELSEIRPDGHCLFSSIAEQLALLSLLPPSHANYATVRAAASQYIYEHPDNFLPFLPSAEPGGSGIMSPREFQHYCASIRDTGAWGGEPEILALSRAYNVPIHVFQHGKPPIVVHNPSGTPNDGDLHGKNVVRISYHRRMYGLGEHYNSLRPKKRSTIANAIQNIVS
ncbi:OTU-domain-containing protein [Fistulina hepatica ATCC 64428]|nr:OTU-domain-containing protein [Fistulina hepatica ATCC 64428]